MTHRPTVYLAGPIKGLNYDGATQWRDEAIHQLGQYDIDGISPMRAKEFLRDQTFDGRSFDHPLAAQRGIFARDYFDVHRVDAVLMNLIGATAVSIGTMFEAAWTVQTRTPLIVAMEPGNCHDHPFVREAAPFVVSSLTEAYEVVIGILSPIQPRPLPE